MCPYLFSYRQDKFVLSISRQTCESLSGYRHNETAISRHCSHHFLEQILQCVCSVCEWWKSTTLPASLENLSCSLLPKSLHSCLCAILKEREATCETPKVHILLFPL